jgi:excisionase family DNA binding protein
MNTNIAQASRHEAGMPHPTDTPQALVAPLMRAEEVAELLAIKTSTVYELSRRLRDPLPSIRIGRSRRFDRQAITRWVEAHATT